MPGPSDLKLALTRLSAAADNADELAWAIEQASFLDDQPGDERQKLRGKHHLFALTARRALALQWCTL